LLVAGFLNRCESTSLIMGEMVDFLVMNYTIEG